MMSLPRVQRDIPQQHVNNINASAQEMALEETSKQVSFLNESHIYFMNHGKSKLFRIY